MVFEDEILGNNFGDSILANLQDLLVPVRVQSVIYDDTHPRFNELGGWNSIGTIEFSSVRNPLASQLPKYQTARPFFSNIKQYPVENELVLLIQGLAPIEGQENVSDQTNYYVAIYNTWNTPHQNASPNPFQALSPNLAQKDYVTANAGSPNVITGQNPTIYLGPGFQEQKDIHPAQSYPGDIIYEGRWGSSIRFGSTAENPKTNEWSSAGPVGSPILIIKNGQFKDPLIRGWIPLSDYINEDDASIYLGSTQKIPLRAASTNDYFSYKSNPPQNPGQYAGKQVIITSGRIVLNASSDHILFSSNQSINLNAVQSINFDTTGDVVIQSGKTYIGSKNAVEPLLLGNATVNLLGTLLQALKIYFNTLGNTPTAPAGAINPITQVSTQNMVGLIDALDKQLDLITSNSNYTI
jgi:hypothetical protein